MITEFHLSVFWVLTLSWLTGTLRQIRATINVMSKTCAFCTMTSQNVDCIIHGCIISFQLKQSTEINLDFYTQFRWKGFTLRNAAISL